MKKLVFYKGKTYLIEIVWGGNSYLVRVVEGLAGLYYGGYHSVPMDCLSDVEKAKPYIIKAIENNYDLKAINEWDGKL